MRFSKFAVMMVGAAMVLTSSAAYAQGGIQKPEVGVGYMFASAKQSGDSDRTKFNGFYVNFSGEIPGVKSMPLVWRWIGQFDGVFKGGENGGDGIKVWGYSGGVKFLSTTNPNVTPFGQVTIGGGHVGEGSFSANGLQFDVEGGAGFPVTKMLNAEVGVYYRRLQLSDDNGGGVNIIGVRAGLVIPINK